MKRVLILIPRMGGGGAERVVSIVANSLSTEYEMQITTLVSDESFYLLDRNVKLTSANYCINRTNKLTRLMSMGRNFLGSIFFTRKTIKEYKPDIVFSLLEEMDVVTYLATRGLGGFRWICSERNDPKRRNPKIQKILEMIYRKSDTLVCQSQTVADYYSMIEKKSVIPNPVDIENYPERVEESKPPRIVSVGRLVPQKNTEMLIEAFSRIADEYPDTTVTVYGEGPERKKLEALIADTHLEGRFILPGTSRNVLETIRDAAVFAFPTEYEGFPNVLVEAIAMGIPVVSTDFATGVAREIIDENVGVVVPCRDVNAFSNALSQLLSNDEKRKHIRSVSHSAIEPFEVKIVIEMWRVLFRTLLEAEQCREL